MCTRQCRGNAKRRIYFQLKSHVQTILLTVWWRRRETCCCCVKICGGLIPQTMWSHIWRRIDGALHVVNQKMEAERANMQLGFLCVCECKLAWQQFFTPLCHSERIAQRCIRSSISVISPVTYHSLMKARISVCMPMGSFAKTNLWYTSGVGRFQSRLFQLCFLFLKYMNCYTYRESVIIY